MTETFRTLLLALLLIALGFFVCALWYAVCEWGFGVDSTLGACLYLAGNYFILGMVNRIFFYVKVLTL